VAGISVPAGLLFIVLGADVGELHERMMSDWFRLS